MTEPVKPSRDYIANRRVLIGVVAAVFLVLAILVAINVPGVIDWIVSTSQSARNTWLSWNWHLL